MSGFVHKYRWLLILFVIVLVGGLVFIGMQSPKIVEQATQQIDKVKGQVDGMLGNEPAVDAEMAATDQSVASAMDEAKQEPKADDSSAPLQGSAAEVQKVLEESSTPGSAQALSSQMEKMEALGEITGAKSDPQSAGQAMAMAKGIAQAVGVAGADVSESRQKMAQMASNMEGSVASMLGGSDEAAQNGTAEAQAAPAASAASGTESAAVPVVSAAASSTPEKQSVDEIMATLDASSSSVAGAVEGMAANKVDQAIGAALKAAPAPAQGAAPASQADAKAEAAKAALAAKEQLASLEAAPKEVVVSKDFTYFGADSGRPTLDLVKMAKQSATSPQDMKTLENIDRLRRGDSGPSQFHAQLAALEGAPASVQNVALEQIEWLLSRRPLYDSGMLNQLAFRQLESGRIPQAEITLKTLLQRYPSSKEGNLNMAYLEINTLNRYEQGMARLERLWKAYPGDAQVYQMMKQARKTY